MGLATLSKFNETASVSRLRMKNTQFVIWKQFENYSYANRILTLNK